jgi:hypothetical protein
LHINNKNIYIKGRYMTTGKTTRNPSPAHIQSAEHTPHVAVDSRTGFITPDEARYVPPKPTPGIPGLPAHPRALVSSTPPQRINVGPASQTRRHPTPHGVLTEIITTRHIGGDILFAQNQLEHIQDANAAPSNRSGNESDSSGNPDNIMALQNQYLPPKLVAAELKLAQIQEKEKFKDDGEGLLSDELYAAQSDYLREASARLRQLSQAPAQLVTPTHRHTAINIAGTVVGNLLAFTIPTAFAQSSKQHSDLIYSVGVAIGLTAAGDVVPIMTRKLHGAMPQLRLSLAKNSSHLGTYKAMVGDFVILMANLAVYGATDTLLSLIPALNTPWGIPLKAGLSGMAMAVVNQPVLTQVAHNTLKRNRVERARFLPETVHSRTIKDGVFFKNEPAWYQRTTPTNKSIEVAARVAGVVTSAAAMFGALSLRPEVIAQGHPAVKAAYDIFLGVGILFTAAAATKAAFTYAVNEPATHANKFQIAANHVLNENISASALNHFEKLLDDVSTTLESGHWDRKQKKIYTEAADIFSGSFHRNEYVQLTTVRAAEQAEKIDKFLEEKFKRQIKSCEDSINPANMSEQAMGIACDKKTTIQDKMAEERQAAPAQIAAAKKDIAKVNAIIKKITNLTQRLESRKSDYDLPSDGTMVKIADILKSICTSLRISTQNALDGKPIQPELKDVARRTRDLQALLLQTQFQLGTDKGLTADIRITQLGQGLLPVFAALRKTDRLHNVKLFTQAVEKFDNKRISEKQFLAKLHTQAHDRIFARDIARHLQNTGQDMARLFETLNPLINQAFDCAPSPPSFSISKLLILSNLLKRQMSETTPRAARETQTECTRIRSTILTFGKLSPHLNTALNNDSNDGEKLDREGVMKQFLYAFKDGQFSVKQLAQELLTLESEQANDSAEFGSSIHEVSTDSPSSNEPDMTKAALYNFKRVMGSEFILTLEEDTMNILTEPDGAEKMTQQMFGALWADVNDMPKSHRELTAAALSLPLHIKPRHLETRLKNDAHFHPTSYSGKQNGLVHLLSYMDRNGIQRTILAGIPSQVREMTAKAKYYANSKHGIDYRDEDYSLSSQYNKLTAEQQERLDLSITGFDVTNGPAIPGALDKRMRDNPGVFKAVGEVTLIKEIVSEKNPKKPIVHAPGKEVDATQIMFYASAVRGFPQITHNDIGTPNNKHGNADNMVAALVEFADTIENWAANDPLRQPGLALSSIPPIKPKVVWAHAAGLARFTADSSNHTKFVERLLENPKLKDILTLDLSWDFVAHYIFENIDDHLTKICEQPFCEASTRQHLLKIAQGFQNLLKTYKTFSEEGSRADKADDLGDLNLSALHRQSAETVAQHYFFALQNFQHTLKRALADVNVRTVFSKQMKEHGNLGNNWLYLLNKYQDRLLFGTDALAVGIKAHGDAAYALNVRVLDPIFEIFDQMGAYETPAEAASDTSFSKVSGKIGYENYMNVFHDPDVVARRTAYENMLLRENPHDWSSAARPQRLVEAGDTSSTEGTPSI